MGVKKVYRAPGAAGLPPFSILRQDIGGSDQAIARHLGIKESTLKTYARRDSAPRSIMLALFWESKWGRSAADTEAANNAAIAYRGETIARRELERMAGIILALELELARSCQGSANSPIFQVS